MTGAVPTVKLSSAYFGPVDTVLDTAPVIVMEFHMYGSRVGHVERAALGRIVQAYLSPLFRAQPTRLAYHQVLLNLLNPIDVAATPKKLHRLVRILTKAR